MIEYDWKMIHLFYVAGTQNICWREDLTTQMIGGNNKVFEDVIIFMRVFWYLIRLRFLLSKFVAEVIRKRYGQKTVKKLRKLEKLDYRLRKALIDLEFLVNYSNNPVVRKFLNFCAATNSLKSSRTYSNVS